MAIHNATPNHETYRYNGFLKQDPVNKDGLTKSGIIFL